MQLTTGCCAYTLSELGLGQRFRLPHQEPSLGKAGAGEAQPSWIRAGSAQAPPDTPRARFLHLLHLDWPLRS